MEQLANLQKEVVATISRLNVLECEKLITIKGIKIKKKQEDVFYFSHTDVRLRDMDVDEEVNGKTRCMVDETDENKSKHF